MRPEDAAAAGKEVSRKNLDQTYREYKRLKSAHQKVIPVEKRQLPPGKTVQEHKEIAVEVRKRHAREFGKEKARLEKLADADAKVTGRVKKLESILGKLEKKPKYGSADKLQDTTGMRVVARDTASVIEHIARVRAEYEIVSEDDYITKPQESGYRSWHGIVKGEDGQEMEIQIRTPNQNDWAIWAHDTYKPQTAAQAELAQSPEVGEYAHAMSEWMARQDEGEDPGPRPRASWKIQTIFKTPGTAVEH